MLCVYFFQGVVAVGVVVEAVEVTVGVGVEEEEGVHLVGVVVAEEEVAKREIEMIVVESSSTDD